MHSRPERVIGHIGTETRPKLLREAAVPLDARPPTTSKRSKRAVATFASANGITARTHSSKLTHSNTTPVDRSCALEDKHEKDRAMSISLRGQLAYFAVATALTTNPSVAHHIFSASKNNVSRETCTGAGIAMGTTNGVPLTKRDTPSDTQRRSIKAPASNI